MSLQGRMCVVPAQQLPHGVIDVSDIQESLRSQTSPGCFPETGQNYLFVCAGQGNCKALCHFAITLVEVNAHLQGQLFRAAAH